MSEDARAELVRAARCTLASRGLRCRELGWSEPPPAGVTEPNIVIETELDLAGGGWRIRARFPQGGGCAVSAGRLVERVRRLPVVGPRLLDEDELSGDLSMAEEMGLGDRRWIGWEGAWREPPTEAPSSATRRAARRPLREERAAWKLLEVLEVDVAISVEAPAAEPWPQRYS